MNKTTNNLKRVWEQLDKASGDLYNALDALASMKGLPEDIKRLSDMIDVTRVDILKNEVEALIEAKGADVSDIAVKDMKKKKIGIMASEILNITDKYLKGAGK